MLNTLRRIVQDVVDASTFEEALRGLVVGVQAALGTQVCSVYLLDRTRDRLVFSATQGLNASFEGKLSLGVDEGLVGLVAQRAEPINLENAQEHPSFRFIEEIGEEPFATFLGVPIIHHREVLGVLVVQQQKQRRFDESEESLLVTLSAQLATSVAHAQATGEIDQLLSGGVSLTAVERVYHGAAGAPGVAIGAAVVIHPLAKLESVPDRAAEDVSTELQVFDKAVNAVRSDIRNISHQFMGSLPAEELALFDAYLHMLDDNALSGDIRARIQEGQWAQGALRQVIREHVRRFEAMEDSYLRERGADVKDLGLRVLAYLQDIRQKKTHFPERTLLVGDEVTASMLAGIPTERLVGIVSLQGSSNSHVSILARALGVPAVMGAVDIPLHKLEGEELIVDGYYGEVFLNPSAERIAEYQEVLVEERALAEELEDLRDLPSITKDGWRIRLWVNIGLAGDISRSLDRGAEGIGLFRTEIPFMSQDRFPSEEEQRVVYREHMEAFEPRPVTMRTLDIGGDKSLSYFPITEDNPFLGWRGIRVTLDHPEIFLVQVRAMLKANEGLEGDLRIMLPMISSLGEVDDARGFIKQAYAEILEEGFRVKPPMVGAMIEVPAAVYQARELAQRLDFLAVGSNDLTQYMLAVDRNNPRVADLYKESHPSVLAALREVARAAHREDTPVGICGELAGTPIGAVLLMAMGYNVLSMNASNLPKVKWVLRNIERKTARRMLAKVLRMQTAEEIDAFMAEQMRAVGLERVLPRHHH